MIMQILTSHCSERLYARSFQFMPPRNHFTPPHLRPPLHNFPPLSLPRTPASPTLPHCYPQVKRNQEDGSSRGFGFVRMKDPAMQLKILNMEHVICGRRCELRSPKRVSGRLSLMGWVRCQLFRTGLGQRKVW